MIVRFFDTDNVSCLYESYWIKASWTRSLSKTGSWSISVPLIAEIFDLVTEGIYVRIYFDGQYQIGGKIKDKNVNYDTDPEIEIVGAEEIDVLYDYGADALLYPDDESYILTFFDLLDRVGWRFGLYKDIDRTRLITLDLRNEKQLLTQIQTLSKQDPDLYYRYGGEDYAGQKLLDVSYFDDLTIDSVYSPSAGEQAADVVIQSASSKNKYGNQIYAARAVGGQFDYGTTESDARAVYTESDAALDADPTLAYDPDYPIYEEVVSSVYVVIPTRVGAIGGSTFGMHISETNAGMIGDISGAGTANAWAQWTFKVAPGRLSEVSFWTGAVVDEVSLKLLSFEWEVCEVNEVTPWIPGTVLATGTIPNTDWTANSRCRVTFDGTEILSTYDKRLIFRCGFSAGPAAGDLITIKALTTSNNARTMRLDRSTQRAASYSNLNYQPHFEAVSEGLVVPVGQRVKLTNSKIMPKPNGTTNFSTAAEAAEAGLSLYEWLIEQIELSYRDDRETPVTLLGADLSWRPGDNIELVKQLQFPEGIRQESEIRKIESITFNASDNQLKMDVKWLNEGDQEPDDPKVTQYDAAQQALDIRWGLYVPIRKPWTMTELTEPISNRSPDTYLSDGTPAITITFTIPATPTAKFETRIIGTPYLIHSNPTMPLDVELVSKLPDSLTIRAAIRNIGWDVYQTATAYAHIVWR
jgi:hypothetical protein